MPESLHPKDAETIEFPPIEKPLACALIALLRRTKNQQVRIEEDEWVSAWLEMPAIRVKRDLTTGDMVVSL